MNNKLLLSSLVAILLSCNTKNEASLPIKTVVFVPQEYFIRPSNLYNSYAIEESIIAFTQKAQGDITLQFNAAAPHIKKAIELEQNSPKESVHWYQKALTCFPSAALYKKVGDMLNELHELYEAKSAYQTALFITKNTRISPLAQQFDKAHQLKTPESSQLYPQAIKLTIATQKYEEAVQMLTEAYENGVISKDFILKDASFQKLRDNNAFKLFSALNLAEGDAKIIARLNYFLENFEKKSLPYTIAAIPPQKNMTDAYESYEIYDNPILEKYKESLLPKDVYVIYNHIRFKDESNYTLLLSSFDTTSLESVTPEYRTFTYMLFSIDKTGEVIDKLPTTFRTPFQEAICTLTDNNIEIRYADRKWKNMDYFTARKNNEFLGTQPTTIKNYTIDSKGKFIAKTTEE
jgi:hypothetical protein